MAKFQYGDVEIRVNAAGSNIHDALVRKIPTEVLGETAIEFIPQAVFRKRDGSGAVHVPLWRLRTGEWKDDDSVDVNLGVRILAPTDLYDEVKQTLVDQGFSFQNETFLNDAEVNPIGDIRVRHAFIITEDLRRGIAKIGFNYFACTNGSAAALRPEFDAIRRYIRYGDTRVQPLVRVVDKTRVPMERDGQKPVVHYLVVEHDDTDTAVLAHLSLFHWVTYQVILSPVLPGDFVLQPSGHLYNVSDLGCYKLTAKPIQDFRPEDKTA